MIKIDPFSPVQRLEPLVVSRVATFAVGSLLWLGGASGAIAERIPEHAAGSPVQHRLVVQPRRAGGLGVPGAWSERWRAEREAQIERRLIREAEWRNAHSTFIDQHQTSIDQSQLNQPSDPHTVRVDGEGH